MIYVVEIANQQGETATKEYEAKSSRELYTRVQRDLRDYPKFVFIGAWEKGQPVSSVFVDIDW
jgi:hypothetical protein